MPTYLAYRPSGGLSVKQFGATGDGSTDDTAAIQEAIDYALANGFRTVYLPDGDYKTTGPIYMDPPVNLRVSTSTIVLQQFTLTLTGPEGGPSHENSGARIKPTGNFRAIWVGPGQAMAIKNISIYRNTGLSRAGRSTELVAVSLSKFGSTFTMDHVAIQGFYKGVDMGSNGDSLTDSNTFNKVTISDCYIGVHIRQAQNYINSLYDCHMAQCKIGVLSDVGKAVNVFGGNYSTHSGYYKKFTISSVSGLTALGDLNYSFTATVSSPDAYLAAGDYDVFCVKHANWGLIPLRLVSYSAGTATLKFDRDWILSTFGENTTMVAAANMATDIATCTTLYCAELVTPFYGQGIHATGIHIENPQAVTCVHNGFSGFNGDTNTTLDNFYFNWDVSGQNYSGSSGDELALFYLQQCTPFLALGNSETVTCRTWSIPAQAQPLLFQASGERQLHFEKANQLRNPTLRYSYNVGHFTQDGFTANSIGNGFGVFDKSPFIAAGANSTANGWRASSLGKSAFHGYNHEPSATPRITPAQLAAIEDNTVGAAGTYPPIHGSTIYAILDWTSGTPTNLFAKAHHVGWSYGKDWACDWSYSGGTNCITVSSTNLFFNGLCIKLDNGVTTQEYIVTGVFPALGYITVMRATDTSDMQTVGTKGTTYTGATIKQSAIVFSKF